MPLSTTLANIAFAPRHAAIARFMRDPFGVQQRQLDWLLRCGAATRYGREYGMEGMRTVEQFQQRVPVVDYESAGELFLRARAGEGDLLWPGKVRWFAKSSGTTSAVSKYIPVTQEGLHRIHLQGPRDVMITYLHNYPRSKVLSGKLLTLGGSKKIEKEGETAFSGDLSAILIENTPRWASRRRCPPPEVALIPDFEQKIDAICRSTVGREVTSFAGVPSWNLVMLRRILQYTGRANVLEVWPHMELFVHGGVNFAPYKAEYDRLFPSEAMHYMDTYNASEGFFSIEDVPGSGDMLLLLDYGQFYEFLPVDSLDDRSKAVPLEGVRTGVNYALIVTSCNGLWRYMLGDTVCFTSTSPHRIRVTGRTKHYINAFGEEVMIDNAEKAVAAAARATGARVAEYTVAPVYMSGGAKGAHQWVIEFAAPPPDPQAFMDEVDRNLQELNSDYRAKRFRDTTLVGPLLTVVPAGTFMAWLAAQGKVGGQNKVPRLSNDRTIVEQILKIEL